MAMSEDSETDLSTMLDNIESLVALCRTQDSLQLASNIDISTYLAIISSDSSISYYSVADRSLLRADIPQKS